MVSLSPRDGTLQPQRLDSAKETDVIRIDLVIVTEEPRAVDGKRPVITARGARTIVRQAGPRGRRVRLREEDGPVDPRTPTRRRLQSGNKTARWDAATASICTRRTRPREARTSTRSVSLERDAVSATIHSLIRNFSRSGKRSRHLIMISLRIRPSWWPLQRRNGWRGARRDPEGRERHRCPAGLIRVRDLTHRPHALLDRDTNNQALRAPPDRLAPTGRAEGAAMDPRTRAAPPESARIADRRDTPATSTAAPIRSPGGLLLGGAASDARWPALPSRPIRVSRGYSYRERAGPHVPSGEGRRDVRFHGPQILIILNSVLGDRQQTPLNNACRS